MSDTLFADVSYFQRLVDDTYPYRFLSIRSNDGTFRDPNFAKNLAWCKSAVARNRLDGFIVYFVWRPNWTDAVNTLKAMVGTPHPKMAVMIDVESWSGKITGNQSAGINAARESLIKWLGGNRKRVLGYANAGDFASLWPNRGDCKVILANYSSNPAFPGKIAHQFSSSFMVAPFGRCDINSADGLTSAQFAVALGLVAGAPAPSPAPKPVTPSKPVINKPAPKPTPPKPAPVHRTYTVKQGDTLSSIAKSYATTYQHLAQLNYIASPFVIKPGQVLQIDGALPAPKPVVKYLTYKVQSGDTLTTIAKRYSSAVTWQSIARLNSIPSPYVIRAGQTLKIG